MSSISTHVLDTSLGKPAADVRVVLADLTADSFEELGSGSTDASGRLVIDRAIGPGTYQLRFGVAEYFARSGRRTFYTEIVIGFTVSDDEHYHVPLLVSPFGYTTYRGS